MLADEFPEKELPLLQENNVRLSTIGRIQTLLPKVQGQLQSTIAATANNTGLELCLALPMAGVKRLWMRLGDYWQIIRLRVPAAQFADHIDEAAAVS